jgi:hypothetical protein
VYQFSLLKQNLEVSKFEAVVLDVQHIQDVSIRSEGSVSFVHPQYGGYVAPPQIFSEDNSFSRLRIEYQNGKKANLDIPQSISVFKGDKVSLFFVKNGSIKKEILGVLQNTETNVTHHFFNFQPPIVHTGMLFGGFFSFFGGVFNFIWKSSPQFFVISIPIAAFFFSLFLRNIDSIYENYIFRNSFYILNLIFDGNNQSSLLEINKNAINDFGDYLRSIRYRYFYDGSWTFIYSVVILLGFAFLSVTIHRRKINKVKEIFFRHIREAVKIL